MSTIPPRPEMNPFLFTQHPNRPWESMFRVEVKACPDGWRARVAVRSDGGRGFAWRYPGWTIPGVNVEPVLFLATSETTPARLATWRSRRRAVRAVTRYCADEYARHRNTVEPKWESA